jgi:hypothetical protein
MRYTAFLFMFNFISTTVHKLKHHQSPPRCLQGRILGSALQPVPITSTSLLECESQFTKTGAHSKKNAYCKKGCPSGLSTRSLAFATNSLICHARQGLSRFSSSASCFVLCDIIVSSWLLYLARRGPGNLCFWSFLSISCSGGIISLFLNPTTLVPRRRQSRAVIR